MGACAALVTGCSASGPVDDAGSGGSAQSTCSDVLAPHTALDAANPQLCTKDGKYVAVLQQTDGNFVLYRNGPGGKEALWATYTQGGERVDMQGDCNLVVPRQGAAAWASGTAGRDRDCRLRLTPSGDLVVESIGRVVWSSETGDDWVKDEGQSTWWNRETLVHLGAKTYVDELRGKKTIDAPAAGAEDGAEIIKLDVWKGIVPTGIPRLRGSREKRTTNITVSGTYPAGHKQFTFEDAEVRFPTHTWTLPELPLAPHGDGIVVGRLNTRAVTTTRAAMLSFTDTSSMFTEEHVFYANEELGLVVVRYARGAESISVLTDFGTGTVSKPHWYAEAIAVAIDGVDPALTRDPTSFRVLHWNVDLGDRLRDLTPEVPVVGLGTKESAHNFALPVLTFDQVMESNQLRLHVSSGDAKPAMRRSGS